MPKVSKRRSFSREFKLKVIGRMEAGERGSDLTRELSIKRTIIYRWRDAARRGGDLALRPKAGRPTKAEAQAMGKIRGQYTYCHHVRRYAASWSSMAESLRPKAFRTLRIVASSGLPFSLRAR